MKAKVLAILVVFLFGGAVWAAIKPIGGGMIGTIYLDGQKIPIPNAIVRLVNVANGKEYFSKPSDFGGVFSLAEFEDGRYAVKIQSGGQEYDSGSRLTLRKGETAQVDLFTRTTSGALGASERAAGVTAVGRLTMNCFRPPQPPRPPRSGHWGPWGHIGGWF
jgi:hypothetical protein